MSGMNLQTSLRAGASYTPLTPAAAQPPSASRSSIGQLAYGVNGSGGDTSGPKTAGYGTVLTGLASGALLVFLWYSLPR
jgi:hypothetical protein